MTKIISGYLLIADITGYTGYLSSSELDHAQDTLTDLLELLVDHTRPPLVISRLAGDAVISYGLGENFIQGQTFVEMIEDTYVAFRRAVDLMVMNNTCNCRACANVGSLDLKFFVHYGSFGIQRIDTHDELVGSDVIVLHRLLKNSVVEATGFRAYTLYTDAAVRQLGIDEIRDKMTPHTETYEHLGKIKIWVQDMLPAWEAKKEAVRIEIPVEKLFLQVETTIDMTPEMVWDYLVHPEFRKILIGSDRQEIIDRQGGRVEVGSTYLCYHGDKLHLQVVLEWQPFSRMVTDDRVWFMGAWILIMVEYILTPEGSRTRLTQRMGNIRGHWISRFLIRALGPVIGPGMNKQFQLDIESFRDHIEADRQANRPDLPLAQISITGEKIAAAAAAGLPPQDGKSAS